MQKVTPRGTEQGGAGKGRAREVPFLSEEKPLPPCPTRGPAESAPATCATDRHTTPVGTRGPLGEA